MEVTIGYMMLPSILGQVVFGDTTYFVRIGECSTQLEDAIRKQTEIIRDFILRCQVELQQSIDLYVVDVTHYETGLQFTLFIHTKSEVIDTRYISTIIERLTTLIGSENRQLAVKTKREEHVSVEELRLFEIEKINRISCKVAELPHYFNAVKILPTKRSSLVVRDRDTIMVLVLDVERTYAMSVKRCWFVISEYEDSRELMRRLAYYLEGKLILVDRIELPQGVYRGWFELELDNGDICTYPLVGKDLMIIVR